MIRILIFCCLIISATAVRCYHQRKLHNVTIKEKEYCDAPALCATEWNNNVAVAKLCSESCVNILKKVGGPSGCIKLGKDGQRELCCCSTNLCNPETLRTPPPPAAALLAESKTNAGAQDNAMTLKWFATVQLPLMGFAMAMVELQKKIKEA